MCIRDRSDIIHYSFRNTSGLYMDMHRNTLVSVYIYIDNTNFRESSSQREPQDPGLGPDIPLVSISEGICDMNMHRSTVVYIYIYI